MSTTSIGRALPRLRAFVRPATGPALRTFLDRLVAVTVREHRLRCDIRSVAALDDHLLRDIDIRRDEIGHAVRNGRRAV